MSRTLKIHLGPRDASLDHSEEVQRALLVHLFRNFGEDVYRALRDDCDVSIEEIDSSISEFHVRSIPTRQLRTVVAKVRKVADHYPGLAPIHVEEVREAAVD